MIKISTAITMAVFLIVTAGSAIAEEIAREGSTSGKTYWTGTFDVLPMEKERVQMSYVGYGVTVSDTGEGILHNASGHVVGGLHAVKSVFEDSGFVSYTRPDGDKVFLTYKASGTLGKSGKGAFTFVGGTGKFVGIQGSGEFTRHSLRSPAKGVFASFTVSKFKWKLPVVE